MDEPHVDIESDTNRDAEVCNVMKGMEIYESIQRRIKPGTDRSEAETGVNHGSTHCHFWCYGEVCLSSNLENTNTERYSDALRDWIPSIWGIILMVSAD